jgi:cupin 2 domain-containing protein
MMNLFAAITDPLPEELIQPLVQAGKIRVERIVSLGHCSPPDFWYDQQEQEFVLLLQGAARLQFESELLDLRPGDWRLIAAHEKHRVDWTTPHEQTVWLAVFFR